MVISNYNEKYGGIFEELYLKTIQSKNCGKFINAFYSRLNHLSSLINIPRSNLREYRECCFCYHNGLLWKETISHKMDQVGREFWSKIQDCPYEELINGESDSDCDREYEDLTLQKIIKILGKVKYGVVFVYDKGFNSEENTTFQRSVNDLVKDLQTMRNTIVSLDLSHNIIHKDLDKLVTKSFHINPIKSKKEYNIRF